ncbi:uncharacterized [Tachysurus ichikawai]
MESRLKGRKAESFSEHGTQHTSWVSAAAQRPGGGNEAMVIVAWQLGLSCPGASSWPVVKILRVPICHLSPWPRCQLRPSAGADFMLNFSLTG